MSDEPHFPAAFINAIREEGTHKEACDWLQQTWNELMLARAEISRLSALPAVQPEPWNPTNSPGMTDLMVEPENIPDLVPLPDTVWICSHMAECGSYYPNAVEAEGNHGGQAIAYIKAAVQPDALHRSFPEAGDGRPFPPMMDELMTAGLVAEDARFVAVQLRQNGYYLAKITHVNETPKREHDPGDVLTPATKEGA